MFKKGLKRSGVFFRLYFLAAPGAAPRLGMAVPKKMAPLAVSRNRIKRVCRETFRQRRHILAAGDFVLVAQAQAKTATPRAALRLISGFFTSILASFRGFLMV